MPLIRPLAGAAFWTHYNRRRQFAIWLVATLLLGVVWLHTWGLIEEDRTRYLANAEKDIANLARLSQEHAERTFQSVDQTLRLVLSQYQEHKGQIDLKGMSEHGVFDSRVLFQVSVIDARGMLQRSSLPFSGRIDLSDREHFQVQVAPGSDALFISRLLRERVSGKWSIQVSRRISGSNGEFEGIVVASLDPAYFSRFYGELKLGQRGSAALIGLDGSVRAQRVGDAPELDDGQASSAVFQRLAQGDQSGTFSERSAHDGVERLQHFKVLPSYPLLVTFARASSEVLAEYEHTKLHLLGHAAVVSLILLALAALLSWYLVVLRRHSQAQQLALLRLQDLTRRVPGMVYQYLRRPDGSSSFPFASDGIQELCGLEPAEVAADGAPLFALIHPDDQAGVAASIDTSARTLKPWVQEFRVMLAGTIRWLSGKAAPQRQADGAVLWHGYLSDVTERKDSEESFITLSAVVEQSPVSVVIVDLDGNISYVNPMFEQITGYRRTEVIGKNPRILSSHEKSAQEYSELWATLLAGKAWQGEFHNRRKDGSLFWERATIAPIFDEGGEPIHYLAIKEDVTGLKAQQATLNAEQAKLRGILNAIPDLLFELGLDGRIYSYHSPRSDLLAAPPQNFLGKLITDILPADAAAVGMAALQEAYEIGHSSGKQYALTLPQGALWFELSLARKSTQPEEAPRFIVLARDITERKHADAQLRIAAIAFESQEGMFVSDAAGVMLRVNQAFSRITGYAAEEAVGKTPNLLSSGRHDAAFYAAMRASIEESGSWQGEIWNRRKNGEIFPEWLTITAVKDAQEAVTHYVSTLTDITRRKAAEDQIKHLAFYDPLTGLPNRKLLIDRLHQAMATSSRSGCEGALLFLDLDHFKTLNDTHGHGRGDLLLQQVGQRLVACVREGDTVARLGGDEYVVMIEDLSKRAHEAAAQAEQLGDKILYSLNLPFDLVGNEYHITPSIGVTLFTDHQNSADELMKRADLAMYQAKAAGRNTLRFFDPEMQAAVNQRAALERDLRCGLQEGQFVLDYQPQVDEQGRLTGVEALVRWQHPLLGRVSPAQFIPLAEEAGLILPLGHWVLQTACVQLTAWASRPHTSHLTLAVNVSAMQFHLDNFVPEVLALLELTGAPAHRLKLELTESLLVKDVDAIIAKMRELKARGVGFSLDDFGTGYSSLSYLKRMPLDQLKIDQSFLHEALTNPNDAAIVRAIVTLGHSLGMMVIAEGVETLAQRDFLVAQGCYSFQGYYFGRPEPVQALERFFHGS